MMGMLHDQLPMGIWWLLWEYDHYHGDIMGNHWEYDGNVAGIWSNMNGNVMGFHRYDDSYGGFLKWWYPNSWMVNFTENPNKCLWTYWMNIGRLSQIDTGYWEFFAETNPERKPEGQRSLYTTVTRDSGGDTMVYFRWLVRELTQQHM